MPNKALTWTTKRAVPALMLSYPMKMMGKFNLRYPRIAQFIANLPAVDGTFLHERTSNIEYPFWNEFEHFLANTDRFNNIHEIVRKLSLKAPLNIDRAWGELAGIQIGSI